MKIEIGLCFYVLIFDSDYVVRDGCLFFVIEIVEIDLFVRVLDVCFVVFCVVMMCNVFSVISIFYVLFFNFCYVWVRVLFRRRLSSFRRFEVEFRKFME